MTADGVLVIDKPSGPTSHDVVARMRRALGERRIGHTGTLDPLATGVLPLVIGKATRLAQFLSATDKTYVAVVRLGVATNTADAEGEAIAERFEGTLPTRDVIERSVLRFRGTFLQQPPAFSAKKIGGKRSYAIARGRDGPERREGARPLPVQVTAHEIDVLAIDGDLVTLRIDCSAGFYIRSLAHDLGVALGTGAHLASLRRTRSGRFTEADAIPLAAAERERAGASIVPLARMLPELPCAVLTDEGVRRAVQGVDIRPSDRESAGSDADVSSGDSVRIRLLNSSGELIAIGEPASRHGHLHASVVLV